MDKKHLSVVKRLIIGVFLSALVSQSHALGLGKLRVNSALDEPLDADIELTSVDEGELESLTAALGSRADFRRAGVDFPEYLNELTFQVAERDGVPVIRVRSDTPAVEPFLHFLIAVEWTGGKLIREYTALLDPPVYAAETPTSVSSPRIVEGEAPEAPAMVDEAPGEEETVRFGEYGPIQKGETLWNIASKLQVEASGVNIFQIMIALLRENPDAFFDNNVNRLKVGQILKIGDLEAIADISPAEAAVAYQAQLEQWQAYREQVAGAADVAKTPAVGDAATMAAPGEAPPEPGAAPTTEPTEAAAAGMGTEDKDVLRIVQATDAQAEQRAEAGVPAPGAAEAQAEIGRLNDQITTLEETLASRELENQELKERVAMLEEQVRNATRLMEIESQELALAQQQAAERQAAQQAAAPAAAETPAAQPTPAPAQQAAVEQPAAEKPAQPAPAARKPSAREQAKAADTGAKPQPQAKPKPRPKPRVTPPPQTSWWEDILGAASDNWTWLMGGLAVLVAGVGGLLFIRRRRSLAEFEESILSGSALDTQTDTTSTGQTSSATTDTSFLSDFGMTGVGSVEADEVDPLAEAEVYLAYGRDEQAEEVLKEAAQRHADRPELKLKLLEIYQQREDLKSFETLAEELYPAGGQGDPDVWQKVVAMGRKMNPNNPLFSQEMSAGIMGATATASAPANADVDIGTDFDDSAVPVDPGLKPFPAPEEDVALDQELEKLANGGDETPEPAAVLEPDDAGAVDLDELDFDLDLEEKAASADDADESEEQAVVDSDDDVLDFEDLEELAESGPPSETPATPSAVESDDDNLLDLDDLDIELEPTEKSDAKDALTAAEDMPGLDFELADDEAEADGEDETQGSADDEEQQWDEAATKLDLAKAYIDMGDKDGARSIIDEVMREGNQQQRDQAAQLASQLGG